MMRGGGGVDGGGGGFAQMKTKEKNIQIPQKNPLQGDGREIPPPQITFLSSMGEVS